MIDLTTVKTYEVLPSLAELHEQNLVLTTKNSTLKVWLIGAAVVIGLGALVLIIRKNQKNGKEDNQIK